MIFSYSVIKQDECEGKSRSSLIGSSIVSVYRLNLVGCFTILKWLTWLLYPVLLFSYTLECLGVSDMAFVDYNCIVSYAVPLGASWVLVPGGRSW